MDFSKWIIIVTDYIKYQTKDGSIQVSLRNQIKTTMGKREK